VIPMLRSRTPAPPSCSTRASPCAMCRSSSACEPDHHRAVRPRPRPARPVAGLRAVRGVLLAEKVARSQRASTGDTTSPTLRRPRGRPAVLPGIGAGRPSGLFLRSLAGQGNAGRQNLQPRDTEHSGRFFSSSPGPGQQGDGWVTAGRGRPGVAGCAGGVRGRAVSSRTEVRARWRLAGAAWTAPGPCPRSARYVRCSPLIATISLSEDALDPGGFKSRYARGGLL
jgi:hypothetical protein